MATVAEALVMAKRHLQGGDLHQAEIVYRQVLQVEPLHAEALHFLGVIALQVGKTDAAIALMEQAIAIAPGNAGFYYNLGSAYQAQGQLDRAMDNYQDALRLQPDFADAQNNLGNALAELGKLDDAVASYQRALALDPRHLAARLNLAKSLKNQGKLEAAATTFQQALMVQPDNAQVHLNLGNLFLEQDKLEEAVTHYQQAVRFNPRDVQAHFSLGNALKMQGRLEEAEASYRLALYLQPDCAEAHYNLGHLFVEQLQLQEAIASFEQAIRLKPDLAGAHASLASVFSEQGRTDEAVASLEQAVRLDPSARLRIALATRLPVIYQSTAEIGTWRSRLIGEVRRLHKQGTMHQLTDEPAVNLFYLPYQGFNDREVLQEVAQLYRAPMPDVRCPVSDVKSISADGHRTSDIGHRTVRVGFVSTFFRSHTIGYWMQGLVAQLSRKDFEVTVLSVGKHEDEVARFFKEHADHYVEVPRHLPSARQMIADQQLDVLFFSDIGMSPITYSLAFSRLAPIQCVTVGHPVTSGIDTIDYFISSEALEPAEAEQHYTEKLVRLKVLPVYYYRQHLPSPLKKRGTFGLAEEDHVFVCPQSLFKIHPDFDALLGGILRGDPRAVLVLSKGTVSHWEQLLRQRFTTTLADVVARIRFMPMLSYPDYLNLLALADVQLDTVPFGGGNTSYDGLTVGTPIVTLPSKLLRGRITWSLYHQMDILDCVAQNPQEYLKISLRLGTDRDERETIRAKILAANSVLFENCEGIRQLEEFLLRASKKKGTVPFEP